MNEQPCRLQQILSKNLLFLNNGIGEGRLYSGVDARRKCGISPKTFNNMLNGRHISKVDSIEKASKLFGVEPADLLREDFIELQGQDDSWKKLSETIHQGGPEAVKSALLRLMMHTRREDVAETISDYIAASGSQD